MPRQYRYLVPAYAFCALLSAAGTARAATTITPNARPTAAETAAARRALPGDFRDAERISHHPLKFTVGHADLKGDGGSDLIIHETGQLFCGSSACAAYALLAGPGGYSTHAINLALFDQSMTILDAKHHGMHDLRFDDSTYVFHWSGTAYK